ncbi:MAG: Rap1a/Tai family immunity protein [Sphingobium phenoxybenzoativorans]|uniref:Rap1a immunity protein domain-containing protein n=1 Tax=Sphingobium phenoxybenzoativorans TaxID=1592790 RepID=A0A975Q073_9SPHN|nr:Rap1a/Tai family immunity protein [Sphingobium phenoxybenzoativorans]QUT04449.1 hypothetical protein KFK14_15450 [Sphingobium phenoxybenzoativorans]
MTLRTWGYLGGAAAFGLFATAASAGFYSGNDLYEICTVERESKTYVEKTYECVAYVTGAVDAFNTTREANNLKSCIPPDVTISQLKDVTVKYLGNNPIDRAKSASSQVFAATRKAWPCSESAGKPTTKAKSAVKKKRK